MHLKIRYRRKTPLGTKGAELDNNGTSLFKIRRGNNGLFNSKVLTAMAKLCRPQNYGASTFKSPILRILSKLTVGFMKRLGISSLKHFSSQ